MTLGSKPSIAGDSLLQVREKVRRFIEERIYPLEKQLDSADRAPRRKLINQLGDEAKAAGL